MFIVKKIFTINNSKGRIIKPGYKKIISKMGLKRGNITGDLCILFNVDFPSFLTNDQIEQLEQIL